MKKNLIVILGPTASGKTSLSVALAKEYNGGIISADSRQVYRGLDIGTSKIQVHEKSGIEHFLIDIVDPQEEFSLAMYQKKAFCAIEKIYQQKKIPFLVGGTGLYIDAVVENYSIPKIPPNQKLRAKLEKMSLAELQKKLSNIDKESAIDLDNPRRIIRAIEIMMTTGKSIKEFQKKEAPKYRVLKIGINWPREELYKRSDQVIDTMIQRGLIDEVQDLLKNGVTHQRLYALGLEYRMVLLFLQKKYLFDEMIEALKNKTHAYIRRQLIWFRRDKNIIWLEPKNALNDARTLVENFL